MNTLLKLTPVVLLLLLFVACETTEVEQNHSESIPTVNVTSSVTRKVSNEPPVFENIENYQSSLDDGRVLYLDNRIFANSGVFDFDPTEKKYFESKLTRDYFELGNGYLSEYKIFEYKDNIILVGHYGTIEYGYYGLVAIYNQTTNKNTIIKTKINYSSPDCYMLGNRLYFSEIVHSNAITFEQFNIKYVNLDTFEVNDVCSYTSETRIEFGRFALRKDGTLALKIVNDKELSNIMTWHSGVFKEVVKSKDCNLIEYDERGVYYIAPDKNSQLISYDEKGKVYYIESDKADENQDLFSYSYDFILHDKNGKETVLLKSTGDDAYKIEGNGIKVFEDYFIRIQDKEIEKYDFTGKLIKKISLKQWPIVWKGKYLYTNCYVAYVNGELMDICYQRETNEIDMQTINLD